MIYLLKWCVLIISYVSLRVSYLGLHPINLQTSDKPILAQILIANYISLEFIKVAIWLFFT